MPNQKLRRFAPSVCAIALLLAGAAPARAGEAIDPTKGTARPGSDRIWYDVKLLEVEGRGWNDTKAFYDRLPAKAEGVVRDHVWNLSRQTAGMCVRFITDARSIEAAWTLTSDKLAMPHMPATGVSGIDLYARQDPWKWHWLAIGQPTGKTTQTKLVDGLPAGSREYLLYLPLYNGVESLEIGLPAGAKLARGDEYKPAHRKPIVFYGTSITQGGCASRPGMVHTAILGRRLGLPVINLGFSGNGRMEPEVAKLLTELDPLCYVLDCLPNMNAAEVTERVEPFVTILRAARPETPIVLVEDRTYADAFLIESKRQRNADSRAALKAAYDRLTKAGMKQISYMEGELLLGQDGEGTVDSSHPTDLGFVQQADALEAPLRFYFDKVLNKQ
jgi:hypothetical protein